MSQIKIDIGGIVSKTITHHLGSNTTRNLVFLEVKKLIHISKHDTISLIFSHQQHNSDVLNHNSDTSNNAS